MEPLTIAMLRALAQERGLELTDGELEGLLPLVQAGRAMMDALPSLVEGEPTTQYRML